MLDMTQREMVGWGFALAGAACAILAAAIKGGTFEALTAAAVAFNGLAGAWGYVNKPAAPASAATTTSPAAK